MTDTTQNLEGWEVPDLVTGRDLSIAESERWHRVVVAVHEYAHQKGMKRSDIVKQTGMKAGTLYDLLQGTYRGVYTDKLDALELWLKGEKEADETKIALITPPDFVETPTAGEVLNALVYAQTAPTIVLITLGSGMSKTSTIQHMMETRPNTFLVTMRETVSAPGNMIRAIAKELDIRQQGTTERYVEQIGLMLKRNGRHTLLMIDEAQFLSDRSVNELRYFYDIFGVGIALLGNEELYGRYGGHAPREGYGQLHRRIGMRIRRMRPQAEDVARYVAAWGFDDPEINRLLTVIGKQHGALGQIAETVKLANIIAVGRQEEMSADHIRQAWKNRGNTEL